MSEAVLQAQGLVRRFKEGPLDVSVLQSVYLTVQAGETVAIVGASGSGKSTLLHLLGLLDAPDVGEILLDGQRIDDLPRTDRDRLRNRVFGFIFQFYHLLPEIGRAHV